MWPWKSNKVEPIRRQDEMLGALEYNERDWTGRMRHGKHEIEISIAGDESGPDPIARQLVTDSLPRLEHLFQEAVAFQLKDLSAEELVMGPYEFRPTGICSGAKWQLDQMSITLTMELAGDDFAIWRVEMGPHGPIDCGRDN
jgi:hypothetical protein